MTVAVPTEASGQEELEHRKQINAGELRELAEAVARLGSCKPDTRGWKRALTQAEDAVDGLKHLEDRSAWPVTFPPEDERQRLLDKLTAVRSRLESTQPDMVDRREAIEEAYEVIEALQDADEDDDWI
ncbi:MAG: hypothetical protein ACREA0_27215 [bacterium]